MIESQTVSRAGKIQAAVQTFNMSGRLGVIESNDVDAKDRVTRVLETGVIEEKAVAIMDGEDQSASKTSTSGVPSEALSDYPLKSSETFELYCNQVQVRLAEHAVQRLSFLQSANERLTRLLHTALAIGDTALYNELMQHQIAVHELLESLDQVASTPAVSVPATSTSALPILPAPAVSTSVLPAPALSQNVAKKDNTSNSPDRSASLDRSNTDVNTIVANLVNHVSSSTNGHTNRDKSEESQTPPLSAGNSMQSSILQELQAGLAVEPTVTPSIVRAPVRPPVDIEADATRLRGSLRDWNTLYPLRHTDTDSGELHVPNCLRLRAVACRMRRLEEEAGDTEVVEVTELARDIEDLLDEAGDEEYTVALDYEIEPQPTAYQWGELAERYEETAHAEEAFGWWIANRAVLSVTDVQALAESVAAIQQRFNRLLFRIGARDPFQQQLFDDLRIWAKEAQCYLYSLRPKVPIAELIEKAQTIDEAWEQARIPVRALEERQNAIQAIIDIVFEPDFGAHTYEDEQRLQKALGHCKELHVPATERRLRDSLLPWTVFIESSEPCKEFLDEVMLEWERRHESGKTAAMESDQAHALETMNLELEAVRVITRGKRCLILGGGMYHEEHRRRIKDTLELAELIWPNARPTDTLDTFETDLRRSDVVALHTRYSRQEWKKAQDLCAREGKQFVPITGNSVAQIVHHFHTKLL